MRTKKIKFKVTASKKLKCSMCKEYLFGKEGFIHIVDGDFWRTSIGNSRICWNCFIRKVIKEINKDRANREKRFNELLKKSIIRNLT